MSLQTAKEKGLVPAYEIQCGKQTIWHAQNQKALSAWCLYIRYQSHHVSCIAHQEESHPSVW